MIPNITDTGLNRGSTGRLSIGRRIKNVSGILTRHPKCLYAFVCMCTVCTCLLALTAFSGIICMYYVLERQKELTGVYTVSIYIAELFLFFVLAVCLFLCIGLFGNIMSCNGMYPFATRRFAFTA